MSSYQVQLPQGVRDYTGEEAYAKSIIEKQVREMFLLCGYEEIQTPCMEYSDVFENGIGSRIAEKTIRFFDEKGKMLVLRPDLTMPAARVVSVQKNEMKAPVRLFYIGNAFGLEHDYGLQQKEFTQAGAELMGAAGSRSDAEILLMASKALYTCGVADYVLDIGHIGIYMSLVEQAGLSDEDAETLRSLLDTKNEQAVADFLQEAKVAQECAEDIVHLVGLYGGLDVLERAKRELKTQSCKQSLEEIAQICDLLCAYGLKEHISLDLSMLPNIDYYTGPVFRGMSKSLGYPLLSGGRYDRMMEQMGRSMPATGFAMGINRILVALEKQKKLPSPSRLDCVVGAEAGCFTSAVQYAEEMRQAGKSCLISFCTNLTDFEGEAREKGAKNNVFFTREERIEITMGGLK